WWDLRGDQASREPIRPQERIPLTINKILPHLWATREGPLTLKEEHQRKKKSFASCTYQNEKKNL
ncbi:hypothetical protein SK128_016824, partial [Halocaridina rubra]